MYNPFFQEPAQMLEKKEVSVGQNPMDGFVNRLRELDRDDLLILLLIFLLFRDGNQDNLWPLLAALVYCML